MAFVLSAIKWQQDKTGRSFQLQFVLIACLQRKVKQWLEFAVNEQTLRARQIYLGATARRFEILQPVPVVQFATWAKKPLQIYSDRGSVKARSKTAGRAVYWEWHYSNYSESLKARKLHIVSLENTNIRCLLPISQIDWQSTLWSPTTPMETNFDKYLPKVFKFYSAL